MLSVVIPYYIDSGNKYFIEDWLVDCEDIEIIFVQDIHNNHPGLSLEYLVAKYSNIRIIHTAGNFEGPGLARNAGMKFANSEFIAFWDIDDLPNVSNFLHMTHEAHSGQYCAGVGFFNKALVNHQNLKIDKLSPQRGLSTFDLALNPGIWRWVFRSSLLKEIYFENINMGEDQVFMQSINVFDHKILKYDDFVYTYMKGWVTQLTNSYRHHIDIESALRMVGRTFWEGSWRSKYFRVVMLVRLFLTLIKSRLTKWN